MRSALLPVESCSPILGLPSLESLKISLAPEDPPTSLLLVLEKLTRLDIIKGSATSVEQYLPAATPCLGNLKYLTLADMKLKTFPISVAGVLTSLTRLDLSYNPIAKLPPGLARITTLRYLCIGCNRVLQLRLCDGATFAALPNLHIVDFTWGGTLFTKWDGSKYFHSGLTSHLDDKMQRRNADMWKALMVKHPQLKGLVVGI